MDATITAILDACIAATAQSDYSARTKYWLRTATAALVTAIQEHNTPNSTPTPASDEPDGGAA